MNRIVAALCAAFLLIGLYGCNNHDDDDSGSNNSSGCANGQCHLHVAVTAPHITIVPPSFVEHTNTIPSPIVIGATTAGEAVLPPVTVTVPPNFVTGPNLIELHVTGVKRAVLVGINKYSDPGAPELAGCVNDAKSLYDLCVNYWGFDPKNIVILLDGDATKANVVAALKNMVAATKDGDLDIYWQSSHGAEDAVSTDANGEPDHLNQMVCCTDFAWDAEHELIDKDFVAIFGKLPKGAVFNWGSDSCHSGDLDRALFKPHTHPKTQKSIVQPAAVKARVAKLKAKSLRPRSIKADILNVGFISGCKPDQTSADTQDENGVPCGALTNYFRKQYLLNPTLPLKDLGQKIDDALSQDGYDQAPQAEGGRIEKAWAQN